MTAHRIRIGIIGAGANTTRTHIPNLRALEGVDLVVVCNRTLASSERVANEWSIPHATDDWRSVVTDPDLDAIVIGTWPNMHCPVTVASLEADKHVLCEARMAMNATEARQMHETARRRPHLVAQLVPAPITLRADPTVHRLLAEGYLGRAVSIEVTSRSGTFSDPTAIRHWRQDVDRSGLNVMSLGIWYETVMRWVGEATEVLAMGMVTVPWRSDQSGRMRAIRIPDHVDVIARMASGAQALFHVSESNGPPPASRIELRGTEGVLVYDGGTLAGVRRNAGSSELQPIPISDAQAGRWRVEEEFVNSIRGLEKVLHTDFETGVKYMEFTEATARSMAQRRAVALPLSLDG